MRTCEQCGGRMQPFVARRMVDGHRMCAGCAGSQRRSAGLKNLAALNNPISERTGKHPQEWYHGSPHDFDDFGDPAAYQDPSLEGETGQYKHWNTLIGNHFTSDHRVAKEFSGGDHSSSEGLPDDYAGPMHHVVHVKLHLKNPKVYASEHDMDQEVYEHEWDEGNHHDRHMPSPPEDDDEYEDWAEEHGDRRHYAGDSKHRYSKTEPDPNYAYGFHPRATGWLNTHPDKEGIVQRYKDRIKRAGYDGVVYGNEYEHSSHGKQAASAIAFEPHQIEITQHHYGHQDCLTSEEARKRTPGPGQLVLPGLEDVQRTLPEEVRPDTSKHWPTTWTPSFFDNKTAARASQGHDTGRLWAPLPQECWDRYYGRHTGAQSRTAAMGDPTDWDAHYDPGMQVHRGVFAKVPFGLWEKLHDPGQVERAGQELADRTSRRKSVGMHWSSDLEQARDFGSPKTTMGLQLPVVLHGQVPAREAIETRPSMLKRNEVFPYDHREREVPLRKGTGVDVFGISWKPEGEHPHADEHGWVRHNFTAPVQHTAAYTMRYTTMGPRGYEDVEREIEGPFYRGGRRKYEKGDHFETGHKGNTWGEDAGQPAQHVYFTNDLDTAIDYARQFPGGGHVHEVEPTGEIKPDHHESDFKTKHPVRVVRHVPRSEWPEWARKTSKTAAEETDEERRARIMRIREERKKRRGTPLQKEVDENGVVHYRTKKPDFSSFFAPIPEEELAARRERAKPKPEPLDDRSYSLDDVSDRYGWEGFDGQEISHLVHRPERARFTHENVPVHSLRLMGGDGQPKPPVSYHSIAGDDEDERDRLHGLEHGYSQGEAIPPIVVVRHGDQHFIADGSHRAAIHAERGDTHIPAFVTERTKFGTTAKLDHGDRTFWHGSATGDLRGGTYGLHVGTREAARQALTAAIGHPVDGEWDGTREYGKTLLAGKHTLQERGITPTGYNYLHAPDHDHYPTGGAGFQATDTKVPMDAKPDIFPVRITGEMSNDMSSPHEDFKANGYMKAQLKRGRAKRGYFYTNQGEDSGSISAVVPNGDHLERLPKGKTSALGEESARQHAGQQDVYAVRSGDTVVNLCAHHRDVHLGNASAADALGDQLGLSGRERSAESFGEARKGSCAACNRDTSYQLKLLTPRWMQNAQDSRARRRPDKPMRTKPLPTLKQSENIRRASKGDAFYADTGYGSGLRFHPDGTPQNLGDHTVPAGAEVHHDENEAWHKAIEHWKNGSSYFPRVYVLHNPKHEGGRLTHESEASELDYDHTRHPAIRSDDEEPHEPIMYHGTTRSEDDDPPEEITPSGGSQSFGPGVADPDYAYATPSLHDAWTYAEKRSENGLGGRPTVYRVTPHKPEDVERDPTWAGEYSRGNNEHDKRSKSGFEVLDEVPMSEKQEHDWRHSPFNDEHDDEDYGDEEDDHRYASLKTLAEWDDDEDEDYEPDECEHCGEDKNSEDHAEVHHDWIRDQKWHTDWDEDREVGAHNNGEIQRGMAISLPKDVHRIVHDEDRPLEERGRALAEHVIKSANDQGHIGRFWTDEDSVARSYATGSRVRPGSKDDNNTPATPVTLHVKFPGYHHIETDPDELEHHGVYSYHIEDNREVPLQHGTPLEAVGVSWAHHKYGDDGTRHRDRDSADWKRHTFKEPIKAMSSKKKLPTLKMLAHDATENEALRHCPFCGAGKIIGRADGSVECEFCHHYFTVQVQPQYPNFPQTINGMPQQIPGMPGQVETPGGAPGMDAGGLPGEEMGQDPGDAPPWAQDGAEGFPDDAAEDKEAGEEDEEEPPPFAKQSFRTVTGALLAEDDYVRHLAIRLAPDRDAMIARIRAERGAR